MLKLIYIPIQLNEDTQKLYEDLKSQGYNLFDKNDKFYKDICTPYKSENGTDVLLSDRYNDFFTPNQLTCQANCEYSDYSPESQYLKCECDIVNDEKIETKEPEKVTAKSIIKSFYDVLKYSNYKVLICYKLVFRKITFTKNLGSILTYLYFIGYFIALIIFSYRKFLYLREEIDKLFKQEKNEENKLKKDINKDILVIYKTKDEINNDDLKNYIGSEKDEKEKNKPKKYKKRKSFSKNKNNIIKVEDKNLLKKYK